MFSRILITLFVFAFLSNICTGSDVFIRISDSEGNEVIGCDISLGFHFNFDELTIRKKVEHSFLSINFEQLLNATATIENSTLFRAVFGDNKTLDARLGLWFLKDGFEPHGILLKDVFAKDKIEVVLKMTKQCTVSFGGLIMEHKLNRHEGMLLCWNLDSYNGYQFFQWQSDFNNVALRIVPTQRYGMVLVIVSGKTIDLLKGSFSIDEKGNMVQAKGTQHFTGIPLPNLDLSKPDQIELVRVNFAKNRFALPQNMMHTYAERLFLEARIKEKLRGSVNQEILYFCDKNNACHILFLNKGGSASSLVPVPVHDL